MGSTSGGWRAVTAIVMAMGIAAAAASPAAAGGAKPSGVSTANTLGDYGRVSWSTRSNGEAVVGYLYAARQAGGGVYVYYLIQVGSSEPIVAYGTISDRALTRRSDGSLDLNVDLRSAPGFTIQGTRMRAFRVLWTPIGKSASALVGTAAMTVGALTQVTSGESSCVPAQVKGGVPGWQITPQQVGEVGTTDSTQQFTLAR
jgi:hypothetical protein